jgi:hypothetical protein
VLVLLAAQRELLALHKQDAPFSQILEYQNWIQRLEIEDDLGPMQSANLDQLELEAEVLELQERAEYLRMTLSVLEAKEQATSSTTCAHTNTHTGAVHPEVESTRDGQSDISDKVHGRENDAGEQGGEQHGADDAGQRSRPSSDIDILKAKLRKVEEQLDHIRGFDPAHARACGQSEEQESTARQPSESSRTELGGALSGKGQGGLQGGSGAGMDTAEGGCGVEGAGCDESGSVAASVIAGLAAELGSKWDARGAEPREGARAAAEGTIEDAPEPCMLAQGTIDTAQRLWKFGLN